MDIVLRGVRWKSCLVNFEDVIVFYTDENQHLKDLDEILGRLDKAGVTIRMKKCRPFSRRVDYLGHKILPGKMADATDPKKAI